MSRKSGHSRVDGMIRDNLTGITFEEGITQTELQSKAAGIIARRLCEETGRSGAPARAIECVPETRTLDLRAEYL